MIRIGTRKSALALWQANQVKMHLDALGATTLIVEIESQGDQNLSDPLYTMGIQGIFTKALDKALLQNKIDIAVHSLKDVPTLLPEGIEIGAVLSRGAHQDVIVYHPNEKQEKIIGTGSLRRKAQWLKKFPDYKVENLRGNIQKRVEKLTHSKWYGAIFAHAGLERLGLSELKYTSLDWMIPAPAQGIIGIACLKNNSNLKPYLTKVNDEKTKLCAQVERSFLNNLEGGCTAPIGAFAKIENQKLSFKGGLFSLNGKDSILIEDEIPIEEAYGFGRVAAQKILDQGGAELMKKIKLQISK
jgi:hydroxymethylbilane synthase